MRKNVRKSYGRLDRLGRYILLSPALSVGYESNIFREVPYFPVMVHKPPYFASGCNRWGKEGVGHSLDNIKLFTTGCIKLLQNQTFTLS